MSIQWMDIPSNWLDWFGSKYRYYLKEYLDGYSEYLRASYLISGIGILSIIIYLIHYPYSRKSVDDINSKYLQKADDGCGEIKIGKYDNERDGELNDKSNSEYLSNFRYTGMDNIRVDRQSMDLLDRILDYCKLLLDNQDPAPLRFYWHDRSDILCRGISRQDLDGSISDKRIKRIESCNDKLSKKVEHCGLLFELRGGSDHELVSKKGLISESDVRSAILQLVWLSDVYIILTEDKRNREVPERISGYLSKVLDNLMGSFKEISSEEEPEWFLSLKKSIPVDDPKILGTKVNIIFDQFGKYTYSFLYEDIVLIRRCIDWLRFGIDKIDLLHWSKDGVLSEGKGGNKKNSDKLIGNIDQTKRGISKYDEFLLRLVPVDDGKPRGDHRLEYTGRSRCSIENLEIFKKQLNGVVRIFFNFYRILDDKFYKEKNRGDLSIKFDLYDMVDEIIDNYIDNYKSTLVNVCNNIDDYQVSGIELPNYEDLRTKITFRFGLSFSNRDKGIDLITLDLEYQYIYLLRELIDWCKGIVLRRSEDGNSLPVFYLHDRGFHWDEGILRRGYDGSDKLARIRIRNVFSSARDRLLESVTPYQMDYVEFKGESFRLYCIDLVKDREYLDLLGERLILLHDLIRVMFGDIYDNKGIDILKELFEHRILGAVKDYVGVSDNHSLGINISHGKASPSLFEGKGNDDLRIERRSTNASGTIIVEDIMIDTKSKDNGKDESCTSMQIRPESMDIELSKLDTKDDGIVSDELTVPGIRKVHTFDDEDNPITLLVNPNIDETKGITISATADENGNDTGISTGNIDSTTYSNPQRYSVTISNMEVNCYEEMLDQCDRLPDGFQDF